MAGDPVIAEVANQIAKLMDVELKDQREADENRVVRSRCAQDFCRVFLEIKNHYAVPLLPKRRGQVTQPQVSLMLEADEHHRSGSITQFQATGSVTQHIEYVLN